MLASLLEVKQILRLLDPQPLGREPLGNIYPVTAILAVALGFDTTDFNDARKKAAAVLQNPLPTRKISDLIGEGWIVDPGVKATKLTIPEVVFKFLIPTLPGRYTVSAPAAALDIDLSTFTPLPQNLLGLVTSNLRPLHPSLTSNAPLRLQTMTEEFSGFNVHRTLQNNLRVYPIIEVMTATIGEDHARSVYATLQKVLSDDDRTSETSENIQATISGFAAVKQHIGKLVAYMDRKWWITLAGYNTHVWHNLLPLTSDTTASQIRNAIQTIGNLSAHGSQGAIDHTMAVSAEASRLPVITQRESMEVMNGVEQQAGALVSETNLGARTISLGAIHPGNITPDIIRVLELTDPFREQQLKINSTQANTAHELATSVHLRDNELKWKLMEFEREKFRADHEFRMAMQAASRDQVQPTPPAGPAAATLPDETPTRRTPGLRGLAGKTPEERRIIAKKGAATRKLKKLQRDVDELERRYSVTSSNIAQGEEDDNAAGPPSRLRPRNVARDSPRDRRAAATRAESQMSNADEKYDFEIDEDIDI